MFNFFKRLFKKGKKEDNGRRLFVVGNDYPCYKDAEMPVHIEFLRPLQSCFRDSYRPEKNCIVDAGTGEGKSPIAYIASRYSLDGGRKIMMTAPTKALVNDLYKSAVAAHGQKVVARCMGKEVDIDIDRKSFIIATPEKYIAEVRAGKSWVKDVGLVIGDESHNLYDNVRGGVFDAAITVARSLYGAKVLLMSGTLPDRQRMIDHFDADCFVCNYESTKLTIIEQIVIDDFDCKEIKQKKGAAEYIFNKDSARLKALRDRLEEHKDKSILIFVPTKSVGFCLQPVLNIPFHCADIPEDDKKKIVSQFNSGEIKALIATSTLAQGVNTPTDIVVIFGTRRGGDFLDYYDTRQMAGRAGRGKTDALAYILADRVEICNSKRKLIAKSLPLPVESMMLTLFSVKPSTKKELCDTLQQTFASTFWPRQKIEDEVGGKLKLLNACRILYDAAGEYSLTPEGIIIAKYMISPVAYIKYIKAAKKLETVRMGDSILANKVKAEAEQTTGSAPSDADAAVIAEKWVKGILLLGLIWSEGGKMAPNGSLPQKYFMEFNTRLPQLGFSTDLGLDSNALAKWAALLKYYSLHPSSVPDYFKWQLDELNMWLYMMREMEKYNILKPMPGREMTYTAMKALQVACAKAEAGKKKNVKTLPLFASQIKPLTEAVIEDQKKAA